jgi:hypothetical protein
MTDDPWGEFTPASAPGSDPWAEFTPVQEVDPRPVKVQIEEMRKLEADRQYERESGLAHFARSMLSGATLGHGPEYIAAIHDSPLSSPQDVALSERQRIERFKNEHPMAYGAANTLGALASPLVTTGAALGVGNALGRLGAAAAPYVAKGAAMAGTGAAFEAGRRTIGEGPTNFLSGVFGR